MSLAVSLRQTSWRGGARAWQGQGIHSLVTPLPPPSPHIFHWYEHNIQTIFDRSFRHTSINIKCVKNTVLLGGHWKFLTGVWGDLVIFSIKFDIMHQHTMSFLSFMPVFVSLVTFWVICFYFNLHSQNVWYMHTHTENYNTNNAWLTEICFITWPKAESYYIDRLRNQ